MITHSSYIKCTGSREARVLFAEAFTELFQSLHMMEKFRACATVSELIHGLEITKKGILEIIMGTALLLMDLQK